MNPGYSQKQPLKLHSPLLEGQRKRPSFNSVRNTGNEEKQKFESIDDALDSTLFKKTRADKEKEKNILSELKQCPIDRLENTLKIISAVVITIGGMLCILEIIEIVRNIQNDISYVNNIVVFTVAFLGTLVSSVICSGFVQIIKTIKHIHSNLENQNALLNKLIHP